MSDSDETGQKPGVPSWQAQSQPTESKEVEDATAELPSRQTVIEQAKKFLEEDEVRNASTGKKIAFLEGKGLTSEEITQLLGVSRNPEATASAQPEPATPQTSQALPSTSSSTSYTPHQARDNPPIITYPEFLTTPLHTTPLVTKSRLLTTLYLFGGLSALLYGTNTYLIEPMLASLTTSRLSLAETTSENLEKLINKLEGVVSEIPASKAGKMEMESEKDEESDEDPTEMFHRDIGVQTSLPTSPSLSRPASPGSTSTQLDDQMARLTSLNVSLSSLAEDSTAEGQETSDLSTTINILKEYLDGLAYVAPSYGYGSTYGALNGNSSKDLDDEIGKVKSSIRGVKGVLLSARSFPGAGGLRAR